MTFSLLRRRPALKLSSRSEVPADQMPKVIVLWSPVPGGKTVLAGALAAGIAQSGLRTVALDLDFLTPNLPWSNYGLEDVAEDFLTNDFRPERLQKELPKAGPQRLWVLGGAEDMVKAEVYGREEVTTLIDTLAKQFDVVVIDTNRSLQMEATLAALYRASEILVPVRMEGRAFQHVSRYLGLLRDGLLIPEDRVKIILNAVKPGEFNRTDVERALRHPIAAEVAFNRAWQEWDGSGWIQALPPVKLSDFFGTAASNPVAENGSGKEGVVDGADD